MTDFIAERKQKAYKFRPECTNVALEYICDSVEYLEVDFQGKCSSSQLAAYTLLKKYLSGIN